MPKINNPGGGDCAFYAFAIGLIDIIQKEYQDNNDSPTFNKWQNLGLDGVSVNELLQTDLCDFSKSPRKDANFILSKLQLSLRLISVNASKDDLLDKIRRESQTTGNTSYIESSPIYGKFMELVKAHIQQIPSRRTLKEMGKFNELALSPACVRLAQTTAKSLEPILKNKSFAEIQLIENRCVKQALLKDVISDEKINTHSAILMAIGIINMKGRWGTHSDLKEIAAKLDVNLCVDNTLNGAMVIGLPTVLVNNHGNAHWTTTIELLTQNHQLEKQIKTEKVDKCKKRLRDEITPFFERGETIFDMGSNGHRKSLKVDNDQPLRRAKIKRSYKIAQDGNNVDVTRLFTSSQHMLAADNNAIDEHKLEEPVSSRLRKRG